MKPHLRIRKAIKWGGAAVTVLLVVVWIGSGWLTGYFIFRRGLTVLVAVGRIEVSVPSPYPQGVKDGRRGLHWSQPHSFRLDFRAYRSTIPGPYGPTTDFVFPLWIPLAVSASAMSAALGFEFRYRRRIRLGLCPRCS